jgi:hypothetical protein
MLLVGSPIPASTNIRTISHGDFPIFALMVSSSARSSRVNRVETVAVLLVFFCVISLFIACRLSTTRKMGYGKKKSCWSTPGIERSWRSILFAEQNQPTTDPAPLAHLQSRAGTADVKAVLGLVVANTLALLFLLILVDQINS